LVNYISPFPKSECVRRFRAAVDAPWKWGGSSSVTGWTGIGSVHARKRIWYRNSFQTVLTAQLRPAGEGTHVAVSTGLSWIVIVFMGVWFSLVGMAVIATGFSSNPGMLYFPAGMLVFGVALVAAGRWFAREEAAFLTAFLIETLDLEKVG
jgi:hypothetical protein